MSSFDGARSKMLASRLMHNRGKRTSDDDGDVEPIEIELESLAEADLFLKMNLYKLVDDEENKTEDTILGNWIVAPKRQLTDFKPVRDGRFPLAICARSHEFLDKVFIDIFRGEMSQILSLSKISDLRGVDLVYSKQGWLLLRRPSSSLFLHNILTGEYRDLPVINRPILGHCYAFSTSSSSVDYVVHVIRERYHQTTICVFRSCDAVWQMYTRKHDRVAIRKITHKGSLQRRFRADFGALNMIIFEKKVYLFDDRDTVDVFDLVKRQWLFLTGLEEQESSFHVTEVDGKIVKIIYARQSNRNLYRFSRLVEWDDGFYPNIRASWVEMSECELENKVWFLGGLASQSFCVNDSLGKEKGAIVYRFIRQYMESETEYGLNIQIHDLKADTTRYVLPFPVFSISQNGWVDLGCEGNGFGYLSESSRIQKMNLEKLITDEENKAEDLIEGNWIVSPRRCLIDFRPNRHSGFPLVFSPRSYCPMFAGSTDHFFIDIFKEEKVAITNISDLRNTELVYSKQGWLLFRQPTRSLNGGFFNVGLFLHNIFTGERLNLPGIDQLTSRAHGFTFSVSSNSVDYVIYVSRQSRVGLTTIFIARPHDTTWEKHTKKREGNTSPDNYFAVVIFQKMVYLFDGSETIDVFDLVERQWLPVYGAQGEMIDFHVREVDGNIVKLYAPDTNLNLYRFSKLVVSYDELNAVNRASWVEMTESELGNKSWFVGGLNSPTFCVKSHEGRGAESNIYRFTSQPVTVESGPGYAMNIQVYDLKAGSMGSVLPFPMFSHVMNRWVDLE